MRILIHPAPSPYKGDVDPDDVVVTRLERSVHNGRLTAWGVLKSERTYEVHSMGWPGDLAGGVVDGPTYRVGYQDDGGLWQAEGCLKRQPPPEPVLRQIEDMERRYAAGIGPEPLGFG